MKQTFLSLALLAVSASALAQTASAPAKTVVAVVNGETITSEKLDQLWERMSPKMKLQYERSGGGKMGFLNNYILKVLMIQEAKRTGYDSNAAVQTELEAAKDSALFDAYVRDVIAATVVTDAEIRKFYDDNLPDFTSQQAKLRLIRVAKGDRPQEARDNMSRIMTDLMDARTKLASEGKHVRELKDVFGKIAGAVSQDPSADNAGDLGWVERGRLPAELEQAAFSMPVETVSGIIESADSYSLLYLEERGNRTESYDDVKGTLREFLIGRKQRDVVDAINKTTAGLRARAKVETFPKNIN